nr:restriction endonuclease subunit S [Candidatus Nitrotoga sp. AM1P]
MLLDSAGVNFVSRTSRNNGISAKVEKLHDVEPIEAGVLTVAGGGSVLETFLQPEPFYSGRDLYYLKPREDMTDAVKLYYCACIRANKYRYSYGRQANRTLKDIEVPALAEVPAWVHQANPHQFDHADIPACTSEKLVPLNTEQWGIFYLNRLFELRKGKGLTKANMMPGNVPFIGAIDGNNGLTAFVGQEALHETNTITVNYNGNGVADAFYQPAPFRCSDDVNVLYPKFTMTAEIALFICTIIRMEKYRFSYGRKWHLERMEHPLLNCQQTKPGNRIGISWKTTSRFCRLARSYRPMPWLLHSADFSFTAKFALEQMGNVAGEAGTSNAVRAVVD